MHSPDVNSKIKHDKIATEPQALGTVWRSFLLTSNSPYEKSHVDLDSNLQLITIIRIQLQLNGKFVSPKKLEVYQFESQYSENVTLKIQPKYKGQKNL